MEAMKEKIDKATKEEEKLKKTGNKLEKSLLLWGMLF